MPRNVRIIGPSGRQVNEKARRAGAAAVLVAASLFAGCGGEGRARSLHEKALVHVGRGELAEAVAILERIERDYPDTEAGRGAPREIVLYRGLMEAHRRDGPRRARETLVRTARAVERHRVQRGAVPASLSDLVPAQIGEVPADPWGRPLVYEARPGGQGYLLAVYGADGTPGGAGEDADVVVKDGRFVADPVEGRE